MESRPELRARGLAIAFAGVLAVSPDAMLLRWMRSLGASSPDVAVAKYIGIIAFMLAFAALRGIGGAFVSPCHFWASAVCQLAYQLSFTFCLLLTDVATALLLISLSPLWAALLGVLVLREPLPTRTVVALALSVASVGLVFTPRLLETAQDADADVEPNPWRSPDPHGSLFGDLLALFTGFAQGASLTVNRHAALRQPKAELTLATAISSLAATVVALYLPCYDSDDVHDFWTCTPAPWGMPGFLVLAVCDALSVASFYTAMMLAPRYITGSEVSLIVLVEIVLGPLWVFLRFGDVPSPWVFAGGSLLLFTLVGHECAGARGAKVQASSSTREVDERPYHRIEKK